MTLVRHRLTDPTDTGVPATFDVTLIGSGLDPDTQSQIIAPLTTPRVGDDGTWEFDLKPNTGAYDGGGMWLGNFYRVTFRANGAAPAARLDIVVPTEGVHWLGDLVVGDTLSEGHPLYTALRGRKGDKGDDGPEGLAGTVIRGPYVAGTAYARRDVVSYLGSSFIAREPNTNITPVEGTSWQLLAQRGTDGSTSVSDGAVTNPKLATGAVDSRAILDGSVTPTDLSFDPATQAELDNAVALLVPKTTLGAANGTATLGPDGKLTSTQLPTTLVPPIVRYKAADTSRVSTTTPADDPELWVTTLPLGVYLFRSLLIARGITTADMLMAFSGTATAAGQLRHDAFPSSQTTFSDPRNAALLDITTGLVIGTGNNNSPHVFEGVVTVSAAGTFGVRWAQNSTQTTATVLVAGSYLFLQKIA